MPRAPGTANTLPAMTLTGTGAAVGSTADWASSQAAMSVVAKNVEYLKIALNEVLVALGQDPLSGIGKPIVPYVDVANGAAYSPLNYANLTVVPAALEDTGGVSSILVTDATAFYASVANAFATLALQYNDFVPAAHTVALTNSTGGTSAAALAANALPAAADGAATTSAPKAGFDTQLGVIRNAISSLAYASNMLATEAGSLPGDMIIDQTGGTVSTTLAAISSSLTAVNGSTGTVAVDEVSALAAMAIIDNSLSSLGYYVNRLAAIYDVPPLGADALGGTISQTLAALSATTATGVGSTGPVTLLNTAVDTWLAGTANNISSIATVLNAMNTMVITSKPLTVIAG